MDSSADEDEDDVYGELSQEALSALRDLANQHNILIEETDDLSEITLAKAVRNHFTDTDRNEIFEVKYKSISRNKEVSFSVKGIKKELGQTLSSTGLTVWRACEYLCDFAFENDFLFVNKSVCELGAGLGMLSILIDKMGVSRKIVATDGDDDALEILSENVDINNSDVEVEKLWWGLHDGFIETHAERFDVVLAADVVYECDQVKPLVQTARDIMKGTQLSSSVTLPCLIRFF